MIFSSFNIYYLYNYYMINFQYKDISWLWHDPKYEEK